jgi:hypothetical protein
MCETSILWGLPHFSGRTNSKRTGSPSGSGANCLCNKVSILCLGVSTFVTEVHEKLAGLVDNAAHCNIAHRTEFPLEVFAS